MHMDSSELMGAIKLYLLCSGGYCAYLIMDYVGFLKGLKSENWRTGIRKFAAIGLMACAWWLPQQYTWKYSPLAQCRNKMEEICTLYRSLERFDQAADSNKVSPISEFRFSIMEYIHSPSPDLTPALETLDGQLYEISHEMQTWDRDYEDDAYEDR
jgi:hypothetical protein